MTRRDFIILAQWFGLSEALTSRGFDGGNARGSMAEIGRRTIRTFVLTLALLVAGLACGASSAHAQAWQNVVVKAGQNKAITVPAGKIMEFLPPAGTPHLTSVKIEYTGENVMSADGDTLLKPPTLLVGPVILTVSLAQSPPGFLVVTYRLKVNQ